MAWKWKVTSVTYQQTVEETDELGNTVQRVIDVSLNGRFSVTFDVLNDSNAVVDTRTLALPYDVDQAATVTRINAEVAHIRDARARVAALQASIGNVVNVP